MMSRVALVVSGLLTLGMAAVAAALVAIDRPMPDEVTAHPAAAWGQAESSEADGGMTATLHVGLTPGAVLLSGGSGGTVTAVTVAPGDVLRAGTKVLEVDAVPVFAYRSETAMYRPLTVGARGSDVAALQHFLNAYLHDELQLDVDGAYGDGTLRRVHDWQRRSGMVVSDVVEPSSFVRLPRDEVVVGSIDATVGAPYVSVGQPLVTGASELAAIEPSGLTPTDDGAYLFTVAGESVPLVLERGSWSTSDALSLLRLAIESDSANDESPSPQAQSSVAVQGWIARAEPLDATAVPAAALVPSGAGGAACIWSGADVTKLTRTVVHLIAIAPSGAALIDAPKLADQQVLLNPVATLGRNAVCP